MKTDRLPLGLYVQITDIEVVLLGEGTLSKALELSVGRMTRQESAENKGGKSCRWSLKPCVNLFQGRKLTLRVQYKHHIRSRISDTSVIAEDIISHSGRAATAKASSYHLGKLFTYGHVFDLPKVGGTRVELTACVLSVFHPERSLRTAGSGVPTPDEVIKGVDSLKSHLAKTGKASEVMPVILAVGAAVSELNTVAKVVVGAVLVLYQALEKEQQFMSSLQSLADDIGAALQCLNELSDADMLERSPSLCTAVLGIMECILETCQFIDDYLNKSSTDKLFAAQFSSELMDKKVLFMRRQDHFRQALHAADMLDRKVQEDQKSLRRFLQPVARGDRPPGCMPNTRRTVLKKMKTFIEDVGGKNIMWIYGSPGAGKTAVFWTVVNEQLGRSAWFHFKEDIGDLRDPSRLWPTIAHDLAGIYPMYAKHLLRTVGTTLSSRIKDQFDTLIRRPFIELQNTEAAFPEPPLVVIDGLDELLHGQHGKLDEWDDLIETFRSWSKISKRMKLIITSRDNPSLEKLLPADMSERIWLPTSSDPDQVLDDETTNDLHAFFKYGFDRIRRYSPETLPQHWPGDDTINQLARQACGIFLWAQTAVDFIGKGGCIGRLVSVLRAEFHHHSALDRLYARIMEFTFEESDLLGTEKESLHDILGAVVLAKDPLSPADIDLLLPGLPHTIAEIQGLVDKLSPVIPLRHEHGTQYYRVCHSSFSEYLLNAKHSGTHSVAVADLSAKLTYGCLSLLNGGRVDFPSLHFNMCSFDTSYSSNSEINNLDHRVESAIPPLLRYCSCFWAFHLYEFLSAQEANVPLRPMLTYELKTFLHSHLLHWLEASSLLGTVHLAHAALVLTARCVKDYDPEIAAFTLDASRFVATFREVIAESVPHIYLSALPLSPKTSLVSTCYRPFLRNTVSATGGLSNWPRPRLLHQLEGHGETLAAAVFSLMPNNAVLMSSSDGSIRYTFPDTGKNLQILHNTYGVHHPYAIACCPEGEYVAVIASDRQVHIHRAKHSRGNPAISQCLSSAHCIKFMQHTYLLAVLDLFGTVHIVKTESGSCHVHIPSPDDELFNCFAVSDNSKGNISIACASRRNLYLYMFQEGRADCLNEPRRFTLPQDGAAAGPIEDVIFSSDSRQIAFVQHFLLVIIDANTGERLKTICLEDEKMPLKAISFSPDNHRLVIAQGCLVRIWDIDQGTSFVVGYHRDVVQTVVFSPDGTRVLSTANDGTAWLWDCGDAEIFSSILDGNLNPRMGFGRITSLAFSENATHIASGMDDGCIIRFGLEEARWTRWWSKMHQAHSREQINCVMYLPDDRIISGGNDCYIKLWTSEEGILNQHRHLRSIQRVGIVSTSGDLVFCDGTGVAVLNLESFDLVASLTNQLNLDDPTRDSIVLFGRITESYTFTLTFKTTHVQSDDENVMVASHQTNIHYALIMSDCTGISTGRIGAETVDKTRAESEEDSEADSEVLACSDKGDVSREGYSTGARGGRFPASAMAIQCAAAQEGHWETIYYSGADDTAVHAWNVQGGFSEPLEASAQVTAIAISGDGSYLAAGTLDGSIRIWILDTNGQNFAARERRENLESIRSFNPNVRKLSAESGTSKTYVGPISGSESFGSHQRAFCDKNGVPIFANHSKLEDGWLYGCGSHRHHRLLWIPPELRPGLLWPGTVTVTDGTSTLLDFSKFVHGSSWTDCLADT